MLSEEWDKSASARNLFGACTLDLVLVVVLAFLVGFFFPVDLVLVPV